MVKGVIFDMDGLMFDTERLASVFWKQAGYGVGEDIPEEFLNSFRGKNGEAIREAFLGHYGARFAYEYCRDLKVKLHYKYIEEKGVPIKKGLIELLDYLKEHGIRMAVATSTERNLANTMLRKAGVYEYFDTFAYGDMVKRSKPHPDIFLKAAEEMQVPIEECLVLEDSVAGVKAGKASGGYIIHIPDVVIVPEKVKEGITAEMESLLDVIEWIKKMNS